MLTPDTARKVEQVVVNGLTINPMPSDLKRAEVEAQFFLLRKDIDTWNPPQPVRTKTIMSLEEAAVLRELVYRDDSLAEEEGQLGRPHILDIEIVHIVGTDYPKVWRLLTVYDTDAEKQVFPC